MLEDPDGTLAAAEDRADLARGEPVHEAKHDDLAAVLGELVERASQATGLLGEAEEPGRIGSGPRLGHDLEGSGLVPMTRAQRVRELVVRDPEEPGTERGALVAKAVDGRQRGDEGPFGGVLGIVVVAEEVEAVSVDAVDVPAIQRPERGAVALRGADVRQIGIRGARPGGRAAARPSRRHRRPHPGHLAAGHDVTTAVRDPRRPTRRSHRGRPRGPCTVPSTVSTLTAEPSVEHRAR